MSRTPAWNRNRPVVPFDENGNMAQPYRWNVDKLSYREVPKTIRKTMKFEGFFNEERIRVSDPEGIVYLAFLNDLIFTIQNYKVEKCEFPELEWRFVKRGQAYGIALEDRING